MSTGAGGIRLLTSQATGEYLRVLAKSSTWKWLYIISPWLSRFPTGIGIGFETFVRRIARETPTVYVLTRPPTEKYHEVAVADLMAIPSVHVAYAPGLHTKLYYAETRTGTFAVFGSPNFTARSFRNQELGIFINGSGETADLTQQLRKYAANLYRTCPGRVKAEGSK